jgi:hypothetical protein
MLEWASSRLPPATFAGPLAFLGWSASCRNPAVSTQVKRTVRLTCVILARLRGLEDEIDNSASRDLFWHDARRKLGSPETSAGTSTPDRTIPRPQASAAYRP